MRRRDKRYMHVDEEFSEWVVAIVTGLLIIGPVLFVVGVYWFFG